MTHQLQDLTPVILATPNFNNGFGADNSFVLLGVVDYTDSCVNYTGVVNVSHLTVSVDVLTPGTLRATQSAAIFAQQRPDSKSFERKQKKTGHVVFFFLAR